MIRKDKLFDKDKQLISSRARIYTKTLISGHTQITKLFHPQRNFLNQSFKVT